MQQTQVYLKETRPLVDELARLNDMSRSRYLRHLIRREARRAGLLAHTNGANDDSRDLPAA